LCARHEWHCWKVRMREVSPDTDARIAAHPRKRIANSHSHTPLHNVRPPSTWMTVPVM
jgi:hypothetical protein